MERRDGTVQTVNPSLLDKYHSKAEHTSNADILYKAREMGMKIWALEKLQRMIATMNDTGAGSHHGHNTRSHNTADTGKGRGDNGLSQVLRNEKINGPSDRDPSAMWKEMILFKGPFIYVHDMEEKTRPAIVREYPRVAKRQDGIWPQFRSAPVGKCPFIDEPPSKKELQRERTASKQAKESKAAVTKSKPVAAAGNKSMNPPERSFEKKAAQEADIQMEEPEKLNEAILSPKQVDPPRMLPTKPGSPKKSSESVIAPVFTRPPMYFRGEPAASGVQPSNITSAIRSQMISSTAAAPGGKAGTSKEVHELKRKVLEKSNGSLSMGGSISSSHRMTDIAGALRNTRVPVTRLAKAKAEKNLGQIDEEGGTPSDDDGSHRHEAAGRKREAPKKTKETRRDPKPGYCENCRDKFDDFEDVCALNLSRLLSTLFTNIF
jgi:regulatory subunit for Cdc7p protein kinase